MQKKAYCKLILNDIRAYSFLSATATALTPYSVMAFISLATKYYVLEMLCTPIQYNIASYINISLLLQYQIT